MNDNHFAELARLLRIYRLPIPVDQHTDEDCPRCGTHSAVYLHFTHIVPYFTVGGRFLGSVRLEGNWHCARCGLLDLPSRPRCEQEIKQLRQWARQLLQSKRQARARRQRKGGAR